MESTLDSRRRIALCQVNEQLLIQSSASHIRLALTFLCFSDFWSAYTAGCHVFGLYIPCSIYDTLISICEFDWQARVQEGYGLEPYRLHLLFPGSSSHFDFAFAHV